MSNAEQEFFRQRSKTNVPRANHMVIEGLRGRIRRNFNPFISLLSPHVLHYYEIFCCIKKSQNFRRFLKEILFSMCSKVIELPHVRQKSDWDCGIACIEMILKKYLGEDFDSEVLSSLGKTLGFGTSVWTIDLANILVHFKLDCVFYTITCGVDPGYKNQEYYQTCFDEDEARVNKLFENAQELGINIVRG